MGWIRGLFGGDAAEEGAPPECEDSPRALAPGAPAAQDPEAEHPVNLATLDAVGASCGLAEVADEVRRLALAAERERERPFLAELSRRLRRRELQLPPMPQAVLRVQRLIDSGTCHMSQLAREIERDPALATRMVGIANSPFYQGLGSVQSVADAVIRIGLGETRNIVLAVVLRSKVFRIPGRHAEVDRLWKHCVAASLAAQSLGAAAGIDPEIGFIAGLLHDLGRVVLLSLGAEIERAVKGSRLGPEARPRIDALLHARLGAVTLESWRVAAPICRAILYHHEPWRAEGDDASLARVAHAADLLAHRIASAKSAAPSEEVWTAALAELGIDAGLAREVESEAREALRARAAEL